MNNRTGTMTPNEWWRLKYITDSHSFSSKHRYTINIARNLHFPIISAIDRRLRQVFRLGGQKHCSSVVLPENPWQDTTDCFFLFF